MKILHKTIACVLILGLILSLNFNFLFLKPKTAQAIDAIGGPFQVLNTIKDSVLDPMASIFSKPAGKIILFELRKLLKGQFDDQNQPLAILDWGRYLDEAVNRGSARFVSEFNQAEIEPGIKSTLKSLGFNQLAKDLPTYSQYSRSTLKDDLGDRYQPFIDSNYSLQVGGWDAWFSLMKPQNNIFGQILMAQQARGTVRTSYTEQEKEAARLQGLAGRGFKDRQQCIKEGFDMENYGACVAGCPADDKSAWDKCEKDCEKNANNGVCLEYKVKNVGSELHSMMEKEIGFDIDWLVSADEIENLFSMLVTTVLGSITHGPGWGTTRSSAPPKSYAYKPYKQDMSFFQLKREPPSIENREKNRSEILNLIFNSIGQMSRQVSTCKVDEKVENKGQLPEDTERNLTRLENQLLEVLEAFTMQLYLQDTGIPLQPDFKVLDPGNAPFKVYGHLWDDIEFQNYPPKCEKFGTECNKFNSKLPAWETHISQQCKDCFSAEDQNLKNCKEGCGYDKGCLTGCTSEKARADAVRNGECPSMAFANNCRNQLDLVYQVKNSCQDCISKAEDSCENQGTKEEEQACVERFCKNDNLFSDLSKAFNIGIADGKDFLNRCETQEKKDACSSCLKQYFMPATYAEQIRDYIGRAFIKHPFLLVETFHAKKDLGDKIKEFAIDAVKVAYMPLYPAKKILGWLFGGPELEKYWTYNLNICIGTCPDIMRQESKCKNSSKDDEVPLSLICRTFPDAPICKAFCDSTKLTKDSLDFTPQDADCNNRTQKGAINPVDLVTTSAFRHRSKFCRALTGHIPQAFKKCVEPQGSRANCQEDYLETCQEEYGLCKDSCGDIQGIREDWSGPECLTMCIEEKVNCEASAQEAEPCEEEEEPEKPTACHSGENPEIPDEGEEGSGGLSTLTTGGPVRYDEGKQHAFIEGIYHQLPSCVILRQWDPGVNNAKVYITKPYCDGVRKQQVGPYWSVYWSEDGDNKFDDQFVGDAHFGEGFLGYCKTNSGQWKNPSPEDILCELDLTDPNLPVDPVTGGKYKVCCGLNTEPIVRTYSNETEGYNACVSAGVNSATISNPYFEGEDMTGRICEGPDGLDNVYQTGGTWLVVQGKDRDGSGSGEICGCADPEKGCGAICSQNMCPAQ